MYTSKYKDSIEHFKIIIILDFEYLCQTILQIQLLLLESFKIS